MRRFGRFIDPAVELPFRFDGAPMRGFAGDTILSALWRNQERAFSRSFKLRRWRGPLSLAADDGATMIDIEGEPNVVAATRPLTANLEIKSRLRAGAVSRLLSASVFGRSLAAPLLRPGFYHRAFFRPRGAWPLWERVIRRLAAEGEIAERGGARARRENLFCDFAVVGGGVAGLAAAVAAAQRGETILFDSSPLVGGAVARFFSDESETLRRLREAARASPRLRILPSFRVNGFFADDLLTAVDSAGSATICARAQKIVFAVGARAQPIVFRGNDIPGVMLVDAAAKLVADYDLSCGRNVVVIGRDERDLALARLLVEHGARVAAVLLLADSDLGDSADSAGVADLPAGIEIRRGIESLEAVAVAGGARLSAICFTSGARAERIECDCALMNGGRVAAAELPLCAGAAWRLSAAGPVLDLRDLPSSIALAGAVNGARAIDEAVADGEAAIEKLAGGEKRAAKRRSKKESEEETIDAAPAAPLGADANANANAIFRHEKGGEFVDFDHDLEIRDIEAAIDEGFDDPGIVEALDDLRDGRFARALFEFAGVADFGARARRGGANRRDSNAAADRARIARAGGGGGAAFSAKTFAAASAASFARGRISPSPANGCGRLFTAARRKSKPNPKRRARARAFAMFRLWAKSSSAARARAIFCGALTPCRRSRAGVRAMSSRSPKTACWRTTASPRGWRTAIII